MLTTLISLNLKYVRIEWIKQEDDTVIAVEKSEANEDSLIIDLGNIDRDKLIDEVVGVLGKELKIPKPILGNIKARLRKLKFPITINLIEHELSNELLFKSTSESFKVIIRYQVL